MLVITLWCALHLLLWSYAFEIGPAADCFGLACTAWLASRAALGCIVLGGSSLALGLGLRKLGHRATGAVLLLLVTLDVAALLLLALHAIV